MKSTNIKAGLGGVWLGCCLVASIAMGIGPAWWVERGVVDTNRPADDYSIVNQGQVKQMARKAGDYLNDSLPGGAGTAVENMILGFSVANNYWPAHVGQLKAVAQPFYDRLLGIGYVNAYPWTTGTADDADCEVANSGQLKRLFDFDHVDPWEKSLPFFAGFETNEGYRTGPLARQQGWSDASTHVLVHTGLQYAGRAAALLEGYEDQARHRFFTTNAVITNSIRVYIDDRSAVRTNANRLPFSAAAAVGYDSRLGFLGFDGTGAGEGHWVVARDTVFSQSWARVNMILNYRTHTWDLSIDGSNKLSNLGFKDHLDRFTGLHVGGSGSGRVGVDEVTIE